MTTVSAEAAGVVAAAAGAGVVAAAAAGAGVVSLIVEDAEDAVTIELLLTRNADGIGKAEQLSTDLFKRCRAMCTRTGVSRCVCAE